MPFTLAVFSLQPGAETNSVPVEFQSPVLANANIWLDPSVSLVGRTPKIMPFSNF